MSSQFAVAGSDTALKRGVAPDFADEFELFFRTARRALLGGRAAFGATPCLGASQRPLPPALAINTGGAPARVSAPGSRRGRGARTPGRVFALRAEGPGSVTVANSPSKLSPSVPGARCPVPAVPGGHVGPPVRAAGCTGRDRTSNRPGAPRLRCAAPCARASSDRETRRAGYPHALASSRSSHRELRRPTGRRRTTPVPRSHRRASRGTAARRTPASCLLGAAGAITRLHRERCRRGHGAVSGRSLTAAFTTPESGLPRRTSPRPAPRAACASNQPASGSATGWSRFLQNFPARSPTAWQAPCGFLAPQVRRYAGPIGNR